ncbi:MAG: DUF2188 domain-containing protein, partial [Candidatus Nanoarchaeia archaeon]
TEELAIEQGKYLSRGESAVFVHNTDGKIRKGFIPKKFKTISIEKLSKLSTKRIHVLPREKEWMVKKENRKQPSKTFSKKFQAIRYAHDQADKTGAIMVIHNADGKISHMDLPPHSQTLIANLLHLR